MQLDLQVQLVILAQQDQPVLQVQLVPQDRPVLQELLDLLVQLVQLVLMQQRFQVF